MELKGDRLFGDNGRNPFSTPQGYFDELPLEIQKQMSKGMQSKVSHRMLSILKHRVAVSFGVLFFVGVAYSGYRYSKSADDAMIKPDEYFEFVSSNSGEFNEQELIKILDSEKKVASKKNLKKESDRIIEYLVNQQLETAAVEALYKDQQNEVN